MFVLLTAALFWIFPCGILATDGDDFANNLFTDLGPLLTLFGERVAIQYLSHSTSWLECVLFACAPLGILTAVVSAIRVSGSRWLKAVIGRAREPAAMVELELMSSTSSDVCELWNGVGMVRVVGSPSIAQLIYQDPSSSAQPENSVSNESADRRVYVDTLKTAQERNLVRLISGPGIRNSTKHADVSELPPNIVLNVTGGTVRGWELILALIVGLLAQSAVLIYDGWLVYWPNTILDVTPASNAYPLTAMGTVGVAVGTFLCAHIIEASTEEEVWDASLTTKQSLQIVWIQRGRVVGDQAFGSFAIFDPRFRRQIRTSRKASETTKVKQFTTLCATVLTVGSNALFHRLRSMHWSASIAQLLATGLMMTVRALVYRRISMMPKVQSL
ncbi:hypothetical protein QBC41DRAFT_233284, partial [Cercophora samala]